MARCQRCDAMAATKGVIYYQNIGLLVARLRRKVEGDLCRRCTTRVFLRMTGVTLIFGWWGMISMIVSPFMIFNNVVQYLSVMRGPWRGGPVTPVAVRMARPVVEPETGPIELEPEREFRPRRKRVAEPIELQQDWEVTQPAAAPAKPLQRDLPAVVTKKNGSMSKEEMAAALKAYHGDMRMRLKGGQTPAVIAAFIAPRTGVPERVVRAYVEKLASR
mgnify:CR=1 FL=1